MPRFIFPVPLLTDTPSSSAVDKAPARMDYTQQEIYQLLANPTRLQQMISKGALHITRLSDTWPAGTSPVFIVSLYGYATFASLERQTHGKVVLRVGDIRIPVSLLSETLTPNPSDLLPVPSAPAASVPVMDGELALSLRNFRRILDASAVTTRPLVATNIFTPPTITLPTRPAAPLSVADEARAEDSNTTTIVDPSQPLIFNDVLTELDSLIVRINNPAIKKQTITIKNAMLALNKQGENPALLIKAINLTNQLLTATPANRGPIVQQCQELALPRRNDPSPAWQIFGVAMIVLGTLITGVGVLTCLAVPGPVGVAGILGGAALLSSGIGMFARGCAHADPQKLMQDLSKTVEKDSSSPILSTI